MIGADIVADRLPPGGIDGVLQRLNRRRIERGGDRVIQFHLAIILSVGIFDNDVRTAITNRPIGDDVIGSPAEIFKSECIIQPRFDGGAGLFVLRNGVIQ